MKPKHRIFTLVWETMTPDGRIVTRVLKPWDQKPNFQTLPEPRNAKNDLPKATCRPCGQQNPGIPKMVLQRILTAIWAPARLYEPLKHCNKIRRLLEPGRMRQRMRQPVSNRKKHMILRQTVSRPHPSAKNVVTTQQEAGTVGTVSFRKSN